MRDRKGMDSEEMLGGTGRSRRGDDNQYVSRESNLFSRKVKNKFLFTVRRKKKVMETEPMKGR